MAEVGIRPLKQSASAVVTMVAAGEPVTIIHHGWPVTLMVPLSASRIDELIASGLARAALRPLSELPPPVRPGRGTPAPSEVLEEMREAERY